MSREGPCFIFKKYFATIWIFEKPEASPLVQCEIFRFFSFFRKFKKSSIFLKFCNRIDVRKSQRILHFWALWAVQNSRFLLEAKRTEDSLRFSALDGLPETFMKNVSERFRKLLSIFLFFERMWRKMGFVFFSWESSLSDLCVSLREFLGLVKMMKF